MKISSKRRRESWSFLLELQNIRFELVFSIHLFLNAFLLPLILLHIFPHVCHIYAYQVSSAGMIVFWPLFWFPGWMVFSWFHWREVRWCWSFT
jgi:hypothetical protein